MKTAWLPRVKPICVTKRLIINFQDKRVLTIDAPKTGAKGFHDICKDKAINRNQDLPVGGETKPIWDPAKLAR
jgi:hypothetical protein